MFLKFLFHTINVYNIRIIFITNITRKNYIQFPLFYYYNELFIILFIILFTNIIYNISLYKYLKHIFFLFFFWFFSNKLFKSNIDKILLYNYFKKRKIILKI